MTSTLNLARNAEIIRRVGAGEGPRPLARAMGISNNIVAGVLNRHRNPYVARARTSQGFRDLARVRAAVAVADDVGLMAASRELKIDAGQLCRWRQRLRLRDGAA